MLMSRRAEQKLVPARVVFNLSRRKGRWHLGPFLRPMPKKRNNLEKKKKSRVGQGKEKSWQPGDKVLATRWCEALRFVLEDRVLCATVSE